MQSSCVLCMGSSAFLNVDLTSHDQWHIFRFRRQPSCSGKFAWLGHYPSLVNRTVTPVEVVKARCHNSSSKLCLQFGPSGPRSLHEMRLRKNFVTPVQFEAIHHAVVVLFVLGATLVKSCQSHGWASWSRKSNVPQLFFQAVLAIWPIWAQISTAIAAVQESQLCDCYRLAGSKMVLDRHCAVQKSEAAKL